MLSRKLKREGLIATYVERVGKNILYLEGNCWTGTYHRTEGRVIVSLFEKDDDVIGEIEI